MRSAFLPAVLLGLGSAHAMPLSDMVALFAEKEAAFDKLAKDPSTRASARLAKKVGNGNLYWHSSESGLSVTLYTVEADGISEAFVYSEDGRLACLDGCGEDRACTEFSDEAFAQAALLECRLSAHWSVARWGG